MPKPKEPTEAELAAEAERQTALLPHGSGRTVIRSSILQREHDEQVAFVAAMLGRETEEMEETDG